MHPWMVESAGAKPLDKEGSLYTYSPDRSISLNAATQHSASYEKEPSHLKSSKMTDHGGGGSNGGGLPGLLLLQVLNFAVELSYGDQQFCDVLFIAEN